MIRYRTIVADPPWSQKAGPQFAKTNACRHCGADENAHTNGSSCRRYSPKKRRDYERGSSSSTNLAYSTMAVAEIAAVAVGDIAASDSHLYPWVTNRYIEDGYRVAREWGFRPIVLLTWAKTPRGIGLGGTFGQSTEHVLFARRGSLGALRRTDSTWWNWTRQDAAHSQKPDAFYDLVESVSPGPRLEIFARRNRLGWDTWGDEALPHVELAS